MPKLSKWSRPDRYVAFICYSRHDSKLASRLHKKLETYVVPRPAQSSLPLARSKKFRPIFRDIEEFAASADLGASIRTALGKSDALIVISSSHASRSRWVNEEIKEFLIRRPEQPIVGVQLAEASDTLEALAQTAVVSHVHLKGSKPSPSSRIRARKLGF